MYKVSELLGKPLITLSEAKILGTISNIYFDAKFTAGQFVSVTDDDYDTYYVPMKNIINLTFDAAVTAGADVLREISAVKSPINSFAFDQDGKELGMVKDIIMDGTAVLKIVAGETEYDASQILNHSDELVIINDSGKQLTIKKSPRKKKPVSATTSFPVQTPAAPQPLPPPVVIHTISVPKKPQSTTVTPSGETEVYNYDFLLNKRLQKSLFNESGVIIARENSLVTSDVIEAARREGKLVQLALHSL